MLNHVVIDIVVVLTSNLHLQLWFSGLLLKYYDDNESEFTFTSNVINLSSPASHFQSSLKSSSDGNLKGPEEPLSKTLPRPHPLTTSQSTEESIVDQEGK